MKKFNNNLNQIKKDQIHYDTSTIKYNKIYMKEKTNILNYLIIWIDRDCGEI